MEACLSVQAGPLAGTVVTIPRGRLLIGRALDCDVRLDDHQVSRHHCVLTFDGRELRIRDLGSSGGTRVNKQRIGLCQIVLHHKDLVSIADTVFQADLAR